MSNSFKVGDRVLLSDQFNLYPFPNWPVMNSEHHSEGTITEVLDRGLFRVVWDNGCCGAHTDPVLVLISNEELPV